MKKKLSWSKGKKSFPRVGKDEGKQPITGKREIKTQAKKRDKSRQLVGTARNWKIQQVYHSCEKAIEFPSPRQSNKEANDAARQKAKRSLHAPRRSVVTWPFLVSQV